LVSDGRQSLSRRASGETRRRCVHWVGVYTACRALASWQAGAQTFLKGKPSKRRRSSAESRWLGVCFISTGSMRATSSARRRDQGAACAAASAGMCRSLGLDTTCRFAQRLLNGRRQALARMGLPVDVVQSHLRADSCPARIVAFQNGWVVGETGQGASHLSSATVRKGVSPGGWPRRGIQTGRDPSPRG